MPGQHEDVLLHELATASADVAATTSRTAKTERLARALAAAQAGEEASLAARYLSGDLRQRRTGLGYAALRERPPPAAEPTLTVREVDAAFERIAGLSGSGSTRARRQALAELLRAATPVEQQLLVGLVGGELRQGALDGVMAEAVARAAGLPGAAVRSAVTVAGSLPDVAAAVLAEGRSGLDHFRLVVGRPLRPMLASSAPDVESALQRLGAAGVEWKLDGIRVQVHRCGSDISVFTRSLDDVTGRVPEVVEAALALSADSFVLDGEAIALARDGRPRPFQETGSRVGRRADVAVARREVPLTFYGFDLLHLDGGDLLGEPLRARVAALAELVPEPLRVPRVETAEPAVAARVLAEALGQGHEGVVAKALEAPYAAGRRGAAWVKVKPVHTLDLVVLAVEWGSGRRTGLLSNLHLGAGDPDGRYGPPGGFVMLGKTFKGLTDEVLGWQTERLLALADGPTDGWVVRVRPELVVEIAFDGVQTSSRYPAGLALRFARVKGYRPDKSASEADTIDAVRATRPR